METRGGVCGGTPTVELQKIERDGATLLRCRILTRVAVFEERKVEKRLAPQSFCLTFIYLGPKYVNKSLTG